ncbi:MAG: hypothetical protein Q7W45_06190 [Bacteroidota bacterium]|nr:hypothetical protein [Bacteroidota bacterium]MDP3145038.1 hypothetical protein [Bacteroidota bacterium]MDP3556070.1 hypothetical protein [Bacteroidota bacterium]
MGKAWLGYLGSFFILLAGVLQIIGDRVIIGSLLILLSIVGAIVKYYIARKQKNQ